MERYRLYGLRLDSEHAFRIPLWPGCGPAELRLEYAPERLRPPAQRRAAYRSPLRTASGESVCALYRLDDGDLLCFPPGEAFFITGSRVLYSPPDVAPVQFLEIRFLGAVMAYWLELHAVTALHASTLKVGGGAVAFAAPRGGGKSSLAVTFVAAGHRLLADDLLAVDCSSGGAIAHAGYPAMRLWPDQVRRFLAGRRELPRVHPDSDKRLVEVGRDLGEFVPDSLSLAALYLPRLVDASAEPVARPLSGASALRELVRCSFTPYIVEAVGLQEERLDRLARLAQDVAVRRLDVPRGLDRLDSVRELVLADLASLPPTGGSVDGRRLR